MRFFLTCLLQRPRSLRLLRLHDLSGLVIIFTLANCIDASIFEKSHERFSIAFGAGLLVAHLPLVLHLPLVHLIFYSATSSFSLLPLRDLLNINHQIIRLRLRHRVLGLNRQLQIRNHSRRRVKLLSVDGGFGIIQIDVNNLLLLLFKLLFLICSGGSRENV